MIGAEKGNENVKGKENVNARESAKESEKGNVKERFGNAKGNGRENAIVTEKENVIGTEMIEMRRSKVRKIY